MQTSLLVTKAFSACTLCARVSPPDTYYGIHTARVQLVSRVGRANAASRRKAPAHATACTFVEWTSPANLSES